MDISPDLILKERQKGVSPALTLHISSSTVLGPSLLWDELAKDEESQGTTAWLFDPIRTRV